MKPIKALIVTAALVLGLAVMLPALRADQVTQSNDGVLTFNETTRFTFSTPVEVPGRVLAPGRYWFIIADTATGNTVQIFDSDKRLVTTVQVGTVERYDTTEATLVTVAEGGPGKPDTLIKWFYPDFREGHEFFYPPAERKALEEAPQKTMVASRTQVK